MKRKALFFDIDGTLGQHGVITESNLKALHLLKEKGYKTFICTGRAPFYAKRLFGDLVSGIISCNGRYILYEGKKLYSRAFTKKQLDYYVHKLDQGKLGAMFVSDDKALKYHLDQKQEVDLEKEYGIEHLVDSLEGDFYTFDNIYEGIAEGIINLKVGYIDEGATTLDSIAVSYCGGSSSWINLVEDVRYDLENGRTIYDEDNMKLTLR